MTPLEQAEAVTLVNGHLSFLGRVQVTLRPIGQTDAPPGTYVAKHAEIIERLDRAKALLLALEAADAERVGATKP